MQQEMTMHRQMDARALDMTSWALNAGNRTQEEKPAELRPLVVKSVEIVPADIVNSNDMQPVPESSTSVNPVSAVDLQTLGSRPEDMKVVDVKPADIRPVEVYSFAEQAPHIERPVRREAQEPVPETTVSMIKQPEEYVEQPAAGDLNENNNDRILRLHKEGYSNVDIAKELGLGVGEVKLVINLFKGAV